jgi:hypothetical protein
VARSASAELAVGGVGEDGRVLSDELVELALGTVRLPATVSGMPEDERAVVCV